MNIRKSLPLLVAVVPFCLPVEQGPVRTPSCPPRDGPVACVARRGTTDVPALIRGGKVSLLLKTGFEEITGRMEWSPDGRSLLVAFRKAGVPHVGVVPVSGEKGPAPVPGERPNWSPDGRKIVFDCDNRILLLDAKTGETAEAGRSAVRAEKRSPVWSADGTRILYVRDGDIWELALATGAEKLFRKRETNLPYTDLHVLPGRPRAVALATERELMGSTGRPGWIIGTDDPASRRILLGNCNNPVFSRDGTKVAFDRAGLVWVMEIAAEEPVQVTTGRYGDEEPSFSADGRTIFFTSRRNDTNRDGAVNWKDDPGIYTVTLPENRPTR